MFVNGIMSALVCFFIFTVRCVVLISGSPPPRLLAPGVEPPSATGCLQGSEVMGGIYASLPPCPPWVDSEGSCHVGDEIFVFDQCLQLMNMSEYQSLPRGRPKAISLPPAINRPQNIEARPPGWSGGGSPPGGWSPSHPPGSQLHHYGPPGNQPFRPGRKDADVLPPSIRNMRRYSSSYVHVPRATAPGHVTEKAPGPPAFNRDRQYNWLRQLRNRKYGPSRPGRFRGTGIFRRQRTGRKLRGRVLKRQNLELRGPPGF